MITVSNRICCDSEFYDQDSGSGWRKRHISLKIFLRLTNAVGQLTLRGTQWRPEGLGLVAPSGWKIAVSTCPLREGLGE